jgi:hypothetical protein
MRRRKRPNDKLARKTDQRVGFLEDAASEGVTPLRGGRVTGLSSKFRTHVVIVSHFRTPQFLIICCFYLPSETKISNGHLLR